MNLINKTEAITREIELKNQLQQRYPIKHRPQIIKVFLSQPMGGKTELEINTNRLRALEKIKEDWKNTNTEIMVFDTNFNFPNEPALTYLAESLKLLAHADIAYFMKDWQYYIGCRLEHQCCKEYKIVVRYLNI